MGRADIEHPWLLERCQEVEREPDGRLDLWARDHYKDLACNTPVPTPTGWALHGELEAGSRVLTLDGRPTRVVATSPVYERGQDYMVHFTDGTTIRAGAGHLWLVMEHSRRRVQYKRISRYPAIRSTAALAAIDHDKLSKRGHRIAIPVNYPLEGALTLLPVAPYTLGAWLGDGTSESAQMTNADAEVWEEIEADGYALGQVTATKGKANTRTVHGLSAQLRGAGLFKNKHIPLAYMRAPMVDRLALLQGLMDTDGSCDTRGTATFAQARESLAQQTYELAATLGLKPIMRERVARDGYRSWAVSFQAHRSLPVFRIRRKAERAIAGQPWGYRYVAVVEPVPKEPTNCIQVADPSGLYLAGREMVPTHNSTVITLGKTIQDVLASHGDEPLEEWGGREVTVGIFSHTRPSAKAFLRQIKRELENNPLLKDLYPDILYDVPDREAPSWSLDDGLIVRRRSNPKEATIESWGIVDGQPTGKHFLRCVYDDVVTRRSVHTPEAIRNTTDAWSLSLNLMAAGGAVRYIGTRYAMGDTYQEMMSRGAAVPRIHPATDDGTEEGEPVLLSPEALRKKRREQGPFTFACQQLQNPVADSAQGFDPEWIQMYREMPPLDRLNVYLMVDPANQKKRESDYTAMMVVGLGRDECYYVLDMVRDRLNLAERGRKLLELHRRWKPIKVGYERYGMQADVDYVRELQGREHYRFEVIELGGTLKNEDRVRRLIPTHEEGRWWYPLNIRYRDWEGSTLDLMAIYREEEYTPFPVGVHVDMMDALSRIFDDSMEAKFPKEPTRAGSKRTRPSASWVV